MFPFAAFFLCVFDKMFIEVPYLDEISPALKNFWLHACTQTLFFLQNEVS